MLDIFGYNLFSSAVTFQRIINENCCFLFADKASVFPQPLDTEAFIRAQTYDVRYGTAVPPVYSWPTDGPRTDLI